MYIKHVYDPLNKSLDQQLLLVLPYRSCPGRSHPVSSERII